MYFFFFQAEDGIRDIGVTGVQTCALPISAAVCGAPRAAAGGEPAACLIRRGGGSSSGRSSWRRRVRTARGPSSPWGLAGRKRVGEGKGVDLGGRRII